MASQIGFNPTVEFLENYPDKDVPPPNSHMFWREAPASQRRNYGVHLFYPSGVYREGKAAFVYWKTTDKCWHILSHREGQTYPNWGESLPEVEEFNYPLGEVPSNFAFEDHTRNRPPSSTSSAAASEDEDSSSQEDEPDTRPRSNTLNQLMQQVQALSIAPPSYQDTMATFTNTPTATATQPTPAPPSQPTSPPVVPSASSSWTSSSRP
jgi:hypothetical protein